MHNHARHMPLAMGALMGLVMPWMMHMPGGEKAGLLFVFAHVVPLLLLVSLALFSRRVRGWLTHVKNHVGSARHLGLMGLGVVLAWAATCAYCLAIGGLHWT